ncbi:TetR family transcriptional regulator [Ammoniphilus oxalaticus]|uniref:TetR family transcriptional regulator n=1 Tax=Ammoniphilus oxalaticus TaxID=66863 RepID=A0A419SGW4_9BACL|nr:TetR/AcrR family transcriptional regulator [Ammoniphilus oxalaticus]RKD23032.1 TetR family transcriptional regulator [Ammoniphilus oxalaticus]
MQAKKRSIPSLVKDPKLVQKRREQIVEAAVGLFISKGFHKTTTREIAKASGFSIGTLYEYIQSKEDVLYLVCESIHTEVEKKMEQALVESNNGAETLRQAISDFLHVMDEVDDKVLLIYQEIKSLPREPMRYVLQRESRITEIFEEMLQRAINDGSLRLDSHSIRLMAHNIVILGEMWVFRRWALRQRYSLAEYIEMQTNLLFGGLRVEA